MRTWRYEEDEMDKYIVFLSNGGDVEVEADRFRESGDKVEFYAYGERIGFFYKKSICGVSRNARLNKWQY